MRFLPALLLAALAFGLVPASADAADRVKPRVRIVKAKATKKGRMTLIDFHLKATDNVGVRSLMVRAAVDGKQGPWRKYPYFEVPGETYHLPFLVDCHTFKFEVYAIDKSRNRSKTATRAFTGL